MTIKLLAQYGDYAPGTILTLAFATEAALIAGNQATTNLAGGVYPTTSTPQYRDLSDAEEAQIRALVSAFGILSPWRMDALVKTVAWANPSQGKSSGLSALDHCTTIKQELEADFRAVRFLRVNRGNAALTNDAAVCFVSETMATDTNANLAFPKIAGTTYAALAGATNINGFRTVTWAGASTLASLGASSSTAFSATLSDWIPLRSTARAGSEPSTRPVLGWRLEHLGSTNGNWAFTTIGTTIRTPQTAMRNRTYVLSTYAASGAIADLTTAKTFSLGATHPDIYPVVRFAVPVFSVWAVGDSITACTGTTTDVQASWVHKACCDLSTPAAPVVYANVGVPSATSADFWLAAKGMLAAGCPPPSMLVLNVGSTNDFGSTPDVRQAENMQALLIEAVSICRQYLIPYLCVWGSPPNENIATAGPDAVRTTSNAELLALATTVKVQWLDITGLGDGASPERYVPAYKYDAVHPNETAQDAIFVPRLKAIIKAAAGL